MDLITKLCHPYWKQFRLADKRVLLGTVLRYFVNPMTEVTDIQPVSYELGGIKTETFSFSLDGEPFVFVPGQLDVVLGWDAGLGALNDLDSDYQRQDLAMAYAAYRQRFVIEGQPHSEPQPFDAEWINAHTSPLRRVAIAPLLVAQKSFTVNSRRVAQYDIVSGEVTSLMADTSIQADVCADLGNFLRTRCADADSWGTVYPQMAWLPNGLRVVMDNSEDFYWVYEPETATVSDIQTRLERQGLQLMTGDEWEYCCGASSRRLFRWGNHLHRTLFGAHSPLYQPNMFGLYIATGQDGPELIADGVGYKGDWLAKTDSFCLRHLLSVSSYAHDSYWQLQADTVLPPHYFCARGIIRIE